MPSAVTPKQAPSTESSDPSKSTTLITQAKSGDSFAQPVIRVSESLETTLISFALPPGTPPESRAFYLALGEAADMHARKQADYGRTEDPFANVRASEDFGIPGWVGCMVRANDKMRRLMKAARGGELANESVEDSLIDLAVYSVIALVLYRETHPKGS